MALGSNSKVNIGIRRVVPGVTPPRRNFEPNGQQTYTVKRASYTHAGNAYASGTTIPFDAAGGTLYSDYARMEREFNTGALDPSS